MRSSNIRMIACALASLGLQLGVVGAAAAQETPALVAAYTRQLAEQCGPVPPGAATPNLVDHLDLNGDKLDDWVVDAGRYPCPGRPAMVAANGAQVTVFKGVPGGFAVPAYQAVAFGARLQRTPEGGLALWVTFGGAGCGETQAQARCERQVVWSVRDERFGVVAPAAKAAPK